MEAPAPRVDSAWDAGELRTKQEVLFVFANTRSAQMLSLLIGVAFVLRRVVGGPSVGVADAIAVAVTVLGAGTVEWVIHRHLLHAPEGTARMRLFGTGRGHREHHRRPSHLGWITLSPLDVIAFVLGLVPFTAAWTGVLSLLPGVGFAPLFTSALVLVAIALAHYEWTHLLVHSGYRPKSRHYAAVARHHRLHHYRNEDYWLGVTSNTGDRLLHTLPDKTDVVPSPTARSLD